MHALLFLALVPCAPAPAEKEMEVPKELKALQGVWKLTAIEENGKEGPEVGPPVTGRPPLVVVGDEFVLLNTAGTLKMGREKREIDLTITEGRTKGLVKPSLFELDGDTLKLAIPGPTRRPPSTKLIFERPKELKSEAGSLVKLCTFERDTKATKEQAAAQLKEQKERVAGLARSGATAAGNEALLLQIIERLDKIDKRLDELEKRLDKPGK
jgi:uncharacterized protein (TIGR03067 family)